jgi:hypothetical protein
MAGEAEWVREKLAAIAGKRAVLAALRDSLDAWERDVDWAALPEEKRAALLGLAHESAETLRAMIRRVSTDIVAGLRELAGPAVRPAPDGSSGPGWIVGQDG